MYTTKAIARSMRRCKVEEIKKAKAQHPNAEVLSHPECPKAVLEISDYVGSTSGIIDYAAKSENEEFIICTENGVRYKLEKDNRARSFYLQRQSLSAQI